MGYLYENLSPERFQQFCQALIVAKFPNTQCLPVGQPDGGRDAYLWQHPTDPGQTRELFIFQVKFGRSPGDRSDNFLDDVASSEEAKVKRLITRGAKAYYLLTNVQGTAHLDSGAIDKADAVLSKRLGIPAFCWWRDDLDRRVDGTLDVKWSYPELISASDLLPVLLEAAIGEGGQRRDSAVQAYLADQYDDDKEVKFKQVDLYNNLLSLFIDVPIQYLGDQGQTHEGPFHYVSRDGHLVFRDKNFGAADYLLGPDSANASSRIVLQGAPGQGKSTITQYICQTQRMRLLDKSAELLGVKEEHRVGEVRLPFRIDLRDYASWVTGNDPFATDVKAPRPSDSNIALESFIAHQITHQSGGQKFNASDFVAIAKNSRILVVLDGFDEVANVALRELLIREISKSAARLETGSLSVQFIVTSRPAAFANSPGFPQKEWAHFSLQSLVLTSINSYAEKWMQARMLSAKDKADFRNLLAQKLDQPHMRDLARNPMQLAILLNLIQKRGLSLPDKRTSLYDNYMELFFNREAEKSTVVRERRDLLIDLHMYLAWLLHGEAESEKGTGSITEERLLIVLKEYLKGEGHDTSLVDDLFAGTVERVGAIVSRVQGTYEFEVQPLREYFAARYLYDTAPHSPPGSEKRGTKPVRFEALSRNFYWLNVTRFYCGCSSRGELSSIVDGLEQLGQSPGMKDISYPKLLALMLLGDWVFSQQPFTVEKVIKFVTSQPGFKILNAALGRGDSGASIELPERCGKNAVLAIAQASFIDDDHADEQIVAANIMKSGMAKGELDKFWRELETRSSDEGKWLLQGDRLGVFQEMPLAEAADLHDAMVGKIIPYFLRNSRTDVLQSNSKIFADAVEFLLNRGVYYLSPNVDKEVGTVIEHLGIACDPHSYLLALNLSSRSGPLAQVWRERRYRMPKRFATAETLKAVVDDELLDRVVEFLGVFQEQGEQPSEVWRTSLNPWNAIVETGARLFGNREIFAEIACVSAGIKSTAERGRVGVDLFDASVPMCERARYARFRAGVPSWWRSQIGAADTEDKVAFVLICLFVLGSSRTIVAADDTVASALDNLSEVRWRRLARVIERARVVIRSSLTDSDGDRLKRCSPRSVALLSNRGGFDGRLCYEAVLRKYAGDDRCILGIAAEQALTRAMEYSEEWEYALPLVKRAYRAGVVTELPILRHGSSATVSSLNATIARKILRDAKEYPVRLLGVADAAMTRSAGSSAPHIREVSKKEAWFADASAP